nr:MAG TPA: peptidase [Caudoviricetes sp.]
MKKIGKFDVPIFNHTVHVFDGLPNEEPRAAAKGYCVINFDTCNVEIYFKNRKVHTNIIVHEIIHAVDWILHNCGIDAGTEKKDSEVRAYLVGYILERTMRIINKKQNKEPKS